MLRSSRRSTPRETSLKIEQLEDRRMLAVTVSLSGADVVFEAPMGDMDDDVLVLSESGGLLAHNLTGGGLAGPTDLDPTTAGVQSLMVSAVTSLTIDLGLGTDRVEFGGGAGFDFAAGSVDATAETIRVDRPAFSTLLDLNLTGDVVVGTDVTFTSATGSILIDGRLDAANDMTGGVATFGATLNTPAGDNTITGEVGGGSELLADFNNDGTVDGLDLAIWTTNDGTMAGASRATGDADGDGDVDGADLLVWQTTTGQTSERDPDGLEFLTTDAGGASGVTNLHGRTVTTTLAQTYNDAVVLTASATLNAGTDVTFASTVDSDALGPRALTVNAMGITTFGGSVGGTNMLQSLQTTFPGETRLAGPVVNTVAAQLYEEDVVLTGDVTLNAGANVTFRRRVNSDGTPRDLTVNTTQDTTFSNAVGSISRLDTLTTNAGGTTHLDGRFVLTENDQEYGDAVELGANTLLDTDNGDLIFLDTVDSDATARTLTLNSPGTTEFLAPVGSNAALAAVTTDAMGTTDLNGGTVTTVGAQTYLDPVILTANTTLNAGTDVTFAMTVNSDALLTPRSLLVNADGITTFGGSVGNAFELQSLQTTLPGETRLAGPVVNTVAAQLYEEDVVLTGDVVINAGASVTFRRRVNSDGTARDLTVNTTQDTTFSNAVGSISRLDTLTTDAGGTTNLDGGFVLTENDQEYADAVILGQNTLLDAAADADPVDANILFASTIDSDGTPRSLGITTPGLATFGGMVGSNSPLQSLDVDSLVTNLHAGEVTTVANQTYSGAVSLSRSATLNAGTDVLFASTVDSDALGPRALTVNAMGITTFGGSVGGTNMLQSLQTTFPGETRLAGPVVNTVAAQLYEEDVVLTGDVTLNAGANVTFRRRVNSDGTPRDLTVNTTQDTTFSNAVGSISRLDTLTTNAGGTTHLDGRFVLTENDQEYGDAVELGANTLLDTDNGDLIFLDTVDSDATARTLTLNSPGTTEFLAPVGSNAALAAVTTDAMGTTDLNGGTVTTVGAQTYLDPVILTANTTLNAGTDVTFAMTVNSDALLTPRSLLVNADGITTFGDSVGNAFELQSLQTTLPGETRLAGPVVNTVAAQLYEEDVVLTGDVVINAGASVTFRRRVNSDGTARDLTVNTTQDTTFSNAVGSISRLDTLTTNAGGTTNLDGGFVLTENDQEYADAIVLGQNTLIDTNSGNVTFESTVDSDGTARSLTVNSPGVTEFRDLVGFFSPLDTISTDKDGTTEVNTILVLSEGDQFFGDDVLLGADVLFSTLSGNVTFHGMVDSDNALTPRELTINSPAVTEFLGPVGSNSPLQSVTTDTPGTTDLNGSEVITIDFQLYRDAVVLTTDVSILAGGDVTFEQTIDGDGMGPWDLTIDTAGTLDFGMDVGSTTPLGSLDATAAEALTIDVNVTTVGNQFYRVPESPALTTTEDITLGAGATLVAGGRIALEAGDDVTLAPTSSIDAAQSLTIAADDGDNDGAGGTISILGATGTISSGTGVTIRTGDDADTVSIQAERLQGGDTFLITTDDGADTIDVFFAADSEISTDADTRVQIDAGAGSDQVTLDHSLDTADRMVRLTLNNAAGTDFNVAEGLGTDNFFRVIGADDVNLLGSPAGVHQLIIEGTPDDDFIEVGPLALFETVDYDFLIIFGGGGNDTIINNTEVCSQLVGGAGNDNITNNTNSPSLIEGNEGDDDLNGGTTTDVIFAGSGSDFLNGNEGDDFLFADTSLVKNQDNVPQGILTIAEPGESDMINGGAGINHIAQTGTQDMITGGTGMLLDGGGQKDVITWLRAMILDFSVEEVNNLVEDAFFGPVLDPITMQPTNKVGITVLPNGCPFDLFQIVMVGMNAPPAPSAISLSPEMADLVWAADSATNANDGAEPWRDVASSLAGQVQSPAGSAQDAAMAEFKAGDWRSA